MKKLNSRETGILIVTVCLLVFFMAYQWVIKPMLGGALDINDRLRKEHRQLIKENQIVAQKDEVEARYQDLATLIGGSNSEEAQVPTIISKIDTTARETNVHIGNIQPQHAITQKEVMFTGVELEIDGQWLDIVNFLYRLQQKPNYYFINELNLEKYSDSTSSLRGRIVISRMTLVNT